MELNFLSILFVAAVVIFLFWLFNSIYVIKEWERGVVLRLGRMLPEPKGAGLQLVLFPIDKLTRISLRIETLDVPPQDVITRDNVSVKVNAVCYFRVVDANLALSQVQNYLYATSQLAQTTLRSLVGQFELDSILSEREKVNSKLQQILDQDTEPWGIKVTKVEVKQVDIPENMQRAIAKQAEAERERRAKIIHAEGEFEASTKLADAAEVLEKQPAAIQLRYLQTLTEIGVEKNTTIVFPLPVDIISQWVRAFAEKKVETNGERRKTRGSGPGSREPASGRPVSRRGASLRRFLHARLCDGEDAIRRARSTPPNALSRTTPERACRKAGPAQPADAAPANGEWDFYSKNNNNDRLQPAAKPAASVAHDGGAPAAPARTVPSSHAAKAVPASERFQTPECRRIAWCCRLPRSRIRATRSRWPTRCSRNIPGFRSRADVGQVLSRAGRPLRGRPKPRNPRKARSTAPVSRLSSSAE